MTGGPARRRALLALLFEHYVGWPAEQPPNGWADAVEHVDALQRIAELPAIRDLDSRIVGSLQ
jgi:hypothetical protein